MRLSIVLLALALPGCAAQGPAGGPLNPGADDRPDPDNPGTNYPGATGTRRNACIHAHIAPAGPI
jgi:hypothetical protein